MKFLNKTVQFAAIIAVTAFGLVACNKKDTTDLLAVDAQLAQKTLLGNYVSVKSRCFQRSIGWKRSGIVQISPYHME